MNALQIRLGKPDDIEGIKNLFQSQLERNPNHALIADAIKNYPSAILCNDLELLGFAYCLYMAPDVVELANITIHKDHRSSGWGSRMLQFLENELNSYSSAILLTNSTLYTSHHKDATSFYEHNGYKIIANTDSTNVFWKSLIS